MKICLAEDRFGFWEERLTPLLQCILKRCTVQITVELDSMSRFETGHNEVVISAATGATGKNVLRALVAALPKLAQTSVDPQKGELYDKESWLAYENGVGIPDLSVPLQLAEGSRLLLLTGGC